MMKNEIRSLIHKTQRLLSELQQALRELEAEENKYDPNAIYWLLDEEAKCAEMFYGLSLRSHAHMTVLGEAERCTKLECKLLLRGLKWKREDIEELTIDDDHPDDKIPF